MNINADKELSYWVLGHQVRPLPTFGDYGMIEVVSLPGVPGPPPHTHDAASEFFYIADGALDVQVDGEWIRLETGQSLCLNPGQEHTLTNRSETPCRWITGWSPRGFEKFFVDFGVEAGTPDAQAASVSDDRIARVVQECSNYGMIIAKP